MGEQHSRAVWRNYRGPQVHTSVVVVRLHGAETRRDASRPVHEAGLGGQFVRTPPIAKQFKVRDQCCGYDATPFEIAHFRISMTVPDGTFSGSPTRLRLFCASKIDFVAASNTTCFVPRSEEATAKVSHVLRAFCGCLFTISLCLCAR